MSQPVERKVWAASSGAGAGGVVATVLIWLLGATAWGGGTGAGEVEAAYAAVPAPVTALITLAVGYASAWLAGYVAKHTPRDVVTLANTDVAYEADPGHVADHRA